MAANTVAVEELDNQEIASSEDEIAASASERSVSFSEDPKGAKEDKNGFVLVVTPEETDTVVMKKVPLHDDHNEQSENEIYADGRLNPFPLTSYKYHTILKPNPDEMDVLRAPTPPQILGNGRFVSPDSPIDEKSYRRKGVRRARRRKPVANLSGEFVKDSETATSQRREETDRTFDLGNLFPYFGGQQGQTKPGKGQSGGNNGGKNQGQSGNSYQQPSDDYSSPLGPVVSSGNDYSAPQGPVLSQGNDYSAPQGSTNDYSAPQGPVVGSSYSPPQPLVSAGDSYGIPQAAQVSNNYSPPQTSSSSYSPPQTPSNSYGSPQNSGNDYSAPQGPCGAE